MRRKKTSEEVDQQLVERNINRLEEYIDSQTPIRWQCTLCDHTWKARPSKILQAHTGCPVCSRLSGDEKRRSGIEEFVEKSIKVHGKRYDYTKVVYVNSHTKVRIGCCKHEFFDQTPTSHLSGNGCPKCMADNFKSSIDEFIGKAKQIHGDAYDYSKFVYRGSQTKGIIVCPTHGEFEQRPNTHISKQAGCRLCDYERRKGSYSYDYFEKHPHHKDDPGYLYVVRLTNDQTFIKIGVAKNVQRRLNSYYNFKRELLYAVPLTLYDAYVLEQHILTLLKPFKFFPLQSFDGRTECVRDGEEVMCLLESLINDIKR